MTTQNKITLALSTVLLALLAALASLYVEQVRALATAEAHAKAQDTTIAAKDRAIAEAQARVDERERAWTDRLAQLAHERAAVKDVPTAQAALTAVAPGASMVEVKRDALTPQAVTGLPDAPTYAVMTKDSAVAVGKLAVDFKACTENTAKLTADVADARQQTQDAKGAEAAADSKARQWETAARGGTVAHRMMTASKWFGLGAVAGAVTYRFVAHN